MLILIIILVLLFGGGGGFYGHSRWGATELVTCAATFPVRWDTRLP